VTAYRVRIGVGTRFSYDGEVAEIIEVLTTPAGNEVVLKAVRDQSIRRMALRELLNSSNARVIPDGPGPGADDDVEIAGVLLAQLSDLERAEVTTRAEHVREVLTGYKSGHSELPQPGEPRPEFDPQLPMEAKYAANPRSLPLQTGPSNAGSVPTANWVWPAWPTKRPINRLEPTVVGLKPRSR